MQLRTLAPLGLALALTGCQSYFPYGYGNSSPYPAMGPGTYMPPSNTAPPAGSSTMQPGTGQLSPAGSNLGNSTGLRGQPTKGQNAVPRYNDPGKVPSSLGAQGSDEEALDSINRQGSQNESPRRMDDADEEPEQALSSVEDDQFLKPTPFRSASASSDDVDAPRPPAKFRKSPYKKDPDGYAWLRGVVVRDPESDAWRITYSRDPLDSDPYNGSITLVDDTLLDTLLDDDVVFIRGRIDRSVKDRYGKPSYRVTYVKPLQEREDN